MILLDVKKFCWTTSPVSSVSCIFLYCCTSPSLHKQLFRTATATIFPVDHAWHCEHIPPTELLPRKRWRSVIHLHTGQARSSSGLNLSQGSHLEQMKCPQGRTNSSSLSSQHEPHSCPTSLIPTS